MQGGLRIFRDWQSETSKPSPPGTASSSQNQQCVDGEIIQIFSRLNLQTLLFPDTHLFPKDFIKQNVRITIEIVPGAFTSLKEARDCLDNCMGYNLQASAAAYFSRQGSENDSDAGRLQDPTNKYLLPQWSSAFDAFIEKTCSTLGPKDLQGAMLIEVQYYCAKILLSVGMPPRETAFDDFGALFEKIVSLATSVVYMSGTCEVSERTGHFSFETGLIPPLYFTATRCRDPWIRREALSLLSSAPRQECVWNSEMLSQIAERVILIEEERDSVGQVTRSEPVSLTSRLSVINATICSAKRQVLIECYQQKCGPDEEIYLLDEWVMY
ncbi:hypothetical protein MMC21_007876 [Puttea exsequens]|nr:hypothetical protein [Puttea exsequens]